MFKRKRVYSPLYLPLLVEKKFSLTCSKEAQAVTLMYTFLLILSLKYSGKNTIRQIEAHPLNDSKFIIKIMSFSSSLR